ncbi:hypothetical protein D3C80_1938730 [compost metagenome]
MHVNFWRIQNTGFTASTDVEYRLFNRTTPGIGTVTDPHHAFAAHFDHCAISDRQGAIAVIPTDVDISRR